MKPFKTVLAAVLAIAPPALAEENIETPSYEVVREVDGVELRRYAPRIVAQVKVEAADRDAASSKGFRPLAGYIFGQNGPDEKIEMTAPVTTSPTGAIPSGSGEKIDMTAPVTTESAGDSTYVVRFTMPSKWTLQTLPKPANPDVELTEVSETLTIAAGFTGERTDERIAELEATLSSFADNNGLEIITPFATAGYDGPDVPSSKRRWEVWADVNQ